MNHQAHGRGCAPALRREAYTPLERLLEPLRDFSQDSPRGALLLALAAAAAFAAASSPWAASWEALWRTPAHVTVGPWRFGETLRWWVNDGLMCVFFFVVGLEIKRELVHGELSSWRRAALPAVAAAGGMLVPAAVFLALNGRGPGAPGWGVPMATDIAFVLGALALLGDRVPVSLKVFVTALAIADDLGAIAAIALFYGHEPRVGPLALGLAAIGLSVAASSARVRHPLVYLLIGALAWAGFVEAGVHPTLAAVLMAFTVPASPVKPTGRPLVVRLGALHATLDRVSGGGREPEVDQALDLLEDEVQRAQAPLQKLERRLAPMVSLLVLPLFALANAGVPLDAGAGGLGDPVLLGVVLGLVVGKPLGIVGFSWLAVRLGLANLPRGTSWRQLLAAGVLAGIGFTMSLFIAELAFREPALVASAKAGVLGGSLVAAAAGLLLLWLAAPRRAPAAGGVA